MWPNPPSLHYLCHPRMWGWYTRPWGTWWWQTRWTKCPLIRNYSLRRGQQFFHCWEQVLPHVGVQQVHPGQEGKSFSDQGPQEETWNLTLKHKDWQELSHCRRVDICHWHSFYSWIGYLRAHCLDCHACWCCRRGGGTNNNDSKEDNDILFGRNHVNPTLVGCQGSVSKKQKNWPNGRNTLSVLRTTQIAIDPRHYVTELSIKLDSREICQKTVAKWFRLSVDLTHDCIYPPTSLGKCFFINLT